MMIPRIRNLRLMTPRSNQLDHCSEAVNSACFCPFNDQSVFFHAFQSILIIFKSKLFPTNKSNYATNELNNCFLFYIGLKIHSTDNAFQTKLVWNSYLSRTLRQFMFLSSHLSFFK